jgi:hypothetical protein
VPEKLRTWLSAVRQWRAERRIEVQWDDAGVTLFEVPSTNAPPLQLRWDEMIAVYAYKRDCVSVDQIRLVLGDDARARRIIRMCAAGDATADTHDLGSGAGA